MGPNVLAFLLCVWKGGGHVSEHEPTLQHDPVLHRTRFHARKSARVAQQDVAGLPASRQLHDAQPDHGLSGENVVDDLKGLAS